MLHIPKMQKSKSRKGNTSSLLADLAGDYDTADRPAATVGTASASAPKVPKSASTVGDANSNAEPNERRETIPPGLLPAGKSSSAPIVSSTSVHSDFIAAPTSLRGGATIDGEDAGTAVAPLPAPVGGRKRARDLATAGSNDDMASDIAGLPCLLPGLFPGVSTSALATKLARPLQLDQPRPQLDLTAMGQRAQQSMERAVKQSRKQAAAAAKRAASAAADSAARLALEKPPPPQSASSSEADAAAPSTASHLAPTGSIFSLAAALSGGGAHKAGTTRQPAVSTATKAPPPPLPGLHAAQIVRLRTLRRDVHGWPGPGSAALNKRYQQWWKSAYAETVKMSATGVLGSPSASATPSAASSGSSKAAPAGATSLLDIRESIRLEEKARRHARMGLLATDTKGKHQHNTGSNKAEQHLPPVLPGSAIHKAMSRGVASSVAMAGAWVQVTRCGRADGRGKAGYLTWIGASNFTLACAAASAGFQLSHVTLPKCGTWLVLRWPDSASVPKGLLAQATSSAGSPSTVGDRPQVLVELEARQLRGDTAPD